MPLFQADTTYAYVRTRRRVLSKTAATNTGTLTTDMPAFTSGLNGTALAAGALAADMPAFTSGLNGTAAVSGSIAATMPEFSAGLNGTSTAQGNLAAAMPTFTADLDGNARATAAVGASLPEFTADLDGLARTSGQLVADMPAMLSGLTGVGTSSGPLSASMPVMGALFNGVGASSGVLGASLPSMTAGLLGTVETTDNFFALMPGFTSDLDAVARSSGSLSAALPAMDGGILAVGTGSGILAGAMPGMEMLLSGGVDLELAGELIIILPRFVMTRNRGPALELNQQRALTREFIASNPIYVALIPNVRVRQPSGGYALDEGVPRPQQMFRLIPRSHTEEPRTSTSAAATSDSGVQRRYDYTLLGEWDSTMQVGDEWETEDGQRLVIENMVSYNGYERKGLVISYGRSPNHA